MPAQAGFPAPRREDLDISEVSKVEALQRILLVEDDARLAGLITEYLGRNGLEVHIERRGDLAVDRAYELEPDLLVLDVMLPGRDGFDVCRELRARGATTPILI